jgi:hypothetical protein
MRKTSLFIILCFLSFLVMQCDLLGIGGILLAPVKTPADTIAGDRVAKESVLRSIPVQYINAARNTLHVAYQHTSHGTHVAYGVYGLPDYKNGDATLFGVSTAATPVAGKLHFLDYSMSGYAEGGNSAVDLSANEIGFIAATRNFLNDPANDAVNVVMWSWCSIAGHNVAGNYLPGMATLIAEFGKGGSNPRAATKPVSFIFMTGHAEADNNVGPGLPKNQADLIINYCRSKKYYCLDYYGIDTHGMDDIYHETANDDGVAGGVAFYQDWQDSHVLGTDWFYNKSAPGGSVDYGAHLSQHITANRKAYAFWYILARIAGWDGN